MTSLPADQIWNLAELTSRLAEAGRKLRKNPAGCGCDHLGRPALMVEMISSAGYHQAGEIAETFGLLYSEQEMNEDELDSLQAAVRTLAVEAAQGLRTRVALPPGLEISLGYDREGNYGLMLHLEDKILSCRSSGQKRIGEWCYGF